MSAKIKVICPSTGRTYDLARNLAEKKVRRGKFRWDGNFTIVEVVACVAVIGRERGAPLWDGLLGVGNILPFARVSNPLRKPAKLHYEIPAVGARARRVCAACINGTSHSHGLSEIAAK